MKLTERNISRFEATAAHDLLATIVRVDYGDEQSGEATGTVELQAPQAIAEFGELVKTLSVPFLQQNRDAVNRGTKELQQYGRINWRYTVETPLNRLLAVGTEHSISHPLAPLTGEAVIISVQHDEKNHTTTATLQIATGPPPDIETRLLTN